MSALFSCFTAKTKPSNGDKISPIINKNKNYDSESNNTVSSNVTVHKMTRKDKSGKTISDSK